MATRQRSGGDRGNRGVSEVIGFVMIVGLVLLGSMALWVGGNVATDNLRDESRVAAATSGMQKADAELETLVDRSNDARVDIELGHRTGSAAVVDRGSIGITVNEASACQTELNLSSLRYRDESGAVVATEGGGVWKTSAAGGTTLVTPPSLSLRRGTVQLSLVQLQGTIEERGNELSVNRTGDGPALARQHIDDLFVGRQCRLPQNMTIEVTSDYYRAWGDYLGQEFGVTPSYDHGADTVTVFLDDSVLRDAPDGSQLPVDLQRCATVDQDTNTLFTPSKCSNGRSYNASMKLLAVQSGYTEGGEGGTYLDTVMVYDQSGSMDYPVTGTETRLDIAKEAGKLYVGIASRRAAGARMGVVGFSDGTGGDALYEHSPLTDDYDAVNGSIDGISTVAGTQIENGLQRMLDEYAANGNDSHKKVAVLLSDGNNENGDNDQVRSLAQTAADRDIVVYTVGMGDANDDLMGDVASTTGGEYYHVDDAENLKDAFRDIAKNATSGQSLVYTPVTVEVADDGTNHVLTPDGSLPARAVDPMADDLNTIDPREYEYGRFELDPGTTVKYTGTSWNCDETVKTGEQVEKDGTTYNVTRCDGTDGARTSSDATPDRMVILKDGARVPTGDGEWWERGLVSVLRSEGLYRNGRLDVRENEVLVIYNASTSSNAYNNVIMLYEAGSTAMYDYVLDLQIAEAQVEEAD